MRKILLSFLILTTLVLGFYYFKFSRNKTYLTPISTSQATPTPQMSEQERTRMLNQQKNTGDVPECNFGRCPEYLDSTWYAYGEEPGGSVVIVPTAMTKQAGEVWVIHIGKVVYKTPSFAQIDAWIEKGNLYISYVSGYKDGITPLGFETKELIYKDEKYHLVEISTPLE